MNTIARSRCISRRRKGATMIETALVLSLLLTCFLVIIDLGMAVLRRNLVSQVAREASRIASVHGAMADATWGPVMITTVASGTDEVASAIRPHLGVLDPEKTTISLKWLDGNTNPESRVQVVVSSKHQPFMTLLFGADEWTLTATSTVQINY